MKRSTIKLGAMLLTASLTMTAVSCKKEGCTDPTATNYSEEADKDDGSCTYADEPTNESEVMVSSNITENTTWTKDKTYILNTRVSVTAGNTLTIEPGTVIKGEVGTGPNATALIIARDAKIMAEGTATEPIIFTTVADEIESGQIASPNMDPTLNGLWGGLIVLGNAPISADAQSVQIEGIPASDQNGLYGGTDAADNSGVLSHISIRHGGANIGEGNEINGLTLGGVGNGTTIEYVEIVSNQDDGIEWFGGSVNVSHAVVWNTGDDAIDTDQAWSGTLDNFVVINPGDECFELDGGEGTYNEMHTLMNGTVQATGASGLADMDFKNSVGNSNVTFNGVYFFDLALGQDFEVDTAFSVATDVTLTDLEATIPSGDVVTDYFVEGSDQSVTVVAAGANTVGANLSEFSGWSWTEVSGALNF